MPVGGDYLRGCLSAGREIRTGGWPEIPLLLSEEVGDRPAVTGWGTRPVSHRCTVFGSTPVALRPGTTLPGLKHVIVTAGTKYRKQVGQ
jgi:hypothetical protein